MKSYTTTLCALTLLASLPLASLANNQPVPRPDLADVVAGTYAGDVTSDSRGSSKSDVTLTVSKTGPNTIQVTSDYARLGTVSFALERMYNQMILAAGNTKATFVYDPSKNPVRLDYSPDGSVAYAGNKE